MKVYHIYPLAKPYEGNFDHYATLRVNERDRRLFGGDDFSGRPYPRKWTPVELYVAQPNRPRPDFFHFGFSAFVCNQRAMEMAQGVLEEAGELLPVTIEREPGNYFIYNVTNCLNVLDHARSKWQPYGPDGKFKRLLEPVFIAERFGDESVFKFPEDPITSYCFERGGDGDEEGFKALVERDGLTGLEFKLVWSDES